jgi:hypothetical protein
MIGNIYFNREEVSTFMKRGNFDILTVVPINDIPIAIAFLKSKQVGNLNKWSKFWSYFNRVWINKYKPQSWNVQSTIDNIINRTNNPVEGKLTINFRI